METQVLVVKFNTSYNFIGELYDMAANFKTPTREQIKSFKVRFADVDRMRDQFDESFSRILAISEDSGKAELELKHRQFYDMFYSLKTMNDDTNIAQSETQNNGSQSQSSKASGMESTRFHLPKIQLTKFKGAHTEWPNLIAIYDSLIHNNPELSSIQRFHYLLSVLEQEPLSLVRHLNISNENYEVAYDLLKERYENKRLIASKHLELLLGVSCPTLVHKNLRRFVNTLKENTQALRALGFDVTSWSFILFHLVSRKMPTELRTKFEFKLKANEIPDFEKLLIFLENNLRVLEVSSSTLTKVQSSDTPTTLHVAQTTCICCGGSHPIFHCEKFDSMSDKKSFIRNKNLCYNCLRPHHVSKCLSKSCCQVCGGRHHTKLHTTEAVGSSTSTQSPPQAIVHNRDTRNGINTNSAHTSNSVNCNQIPSQPSYEADGQLILLNAEPLSTGLLGTALVGVQDSNGQVHVVRSLIDPGAQVSLMSECLAQQLHLQRQRSCDLFGVGEHRQPTHGMVECRITSLINPHHHGLSTAAIILKRITGYQPANQISSRVLDKCRDLMLADSSFHMPGRIDLLLGVDLFDEIFTGAKRKLGEGLPTAHSTIFGWVVMGHSPVTSYTYQSANLVSGNSKLELALTQFWRHEEAPTTHVPDPEDIACEKHFFETHSRDENGRFIVRLPFKVEHKQLGETRPAALKRFHNLERRLAKEPRLRELYVEFMRDYQKSGHMLLKESDDGGERVYIPHHGVLKEDSSTTKLRAVFDASLASTTGVSLNQNLMSGPKLQQDIQDIILRFRLHNVVFTCDIKQMYRNVRMHPEDWRYQTIFWRECPEMPLQEFELTTVTYGVSSSAFQAIRAVHELANLNSELYPEASRALREDIFVDDIVSGCDTPEKAKALQCQLVEVLGQGCFQLRKWSSNRSELLDGFPADHRETPFRFEDSGDYVFKILGIEWNPSEDVFLYRVFEMSRTNTKRGILSNIARLYDPCGFITPVTFFAKSFMQNLWLLDLGWDDPIPPESQQYWSKFVEDFKALHQIRIPRFVLADQPHECHIHGFSDASERGYSACVYLLVKSESDSNIQLVLSKSRVAPVKQKLTVPRLELCGALLLARLLAHVNRVLRAKIIISSTTAWCDSTIVLAWLQTAPHKLQTYEGNRVSQIQGMVPDASWRHVPSLLNPADSASRGLLPSELLNHSLWWGPEWLKDDSPVSAYSAQAVESPGTEPPAAAHSVQAVEIPPVPASTSQTVEEPQILSRFSSLTRLQTTVAWCLRFINNAHRPHHKTKGYLTITELNTALHTCIKLVQASAFHDAIKSLSENKAIKGSLIRLNPFLDKDTGLLRVGGRLSHSSLAYSSKHPVLLPHSHHFTHLLIDHYHLLFGHAGAATLLTVIHRRFWILSARRVVRHRIFKCLRCYRLKVKPLAPFMGNLPASRVTQARVFQKVGVDFAGTFTVRASHIRTTKTYKAYLCVFICFVSKAVHLEVVSALSTDAFMACLDRFVSRRGLPSDIYSDCGTNFVGARNHLQKIYDQIDEVQLQQKLTPQQIKWHFNPPAGAHHGGLWESAVKAAKTLLLRIIGERVLTFEELTTVFTKVEAIINSRPLCPISSDPNDFDVLTPGHFLIGQPLLCLPEQNVEQTPVNRLSRWQLLQHITQHLWKRWHSEYLHTLQQRCRWLTSRPNLQVGDLVLLVEPNIAPLQWRRARITKVCPGADGIVRVVEIKTSSGMLLRPVVKLCPLLHDN